MWEKILGPLDQALFSLKTFHEMNLGDLWSTWLLANPIHVQSRQWPNQEELFTSSTRCSFHVPPHVEISEVRSHNSLIRTRVLSDGCWIGSSRTFRISRSYSISQQLSRINGDSCVSRSSSFRDFWSSKYNFWIISQFPFVPWGIGTHVSKLFFLVFHLFDCARPSQHRMVMILGSWELHCLVS